MINEVFKSKLVGFVDKINCNTTNLADYTANPSKNTKSYLEEMMKMS